MNRHNLPLAWHAATDMSAIGWVMIAYSSNCLISQEWLASIAEGDSIINATLNEQDGGLNLLLCMWFLVQMETVCDAHIPHSVGTQ